MILNDSLPFKLPYGFVAIDRWSDFTGTGEGFLIAAYITQHRKKTLPVAQIRLFNDGKAELEIIPTARNTKFGRDSWKRICEYFTNVSYIPTYHISLSSL